jgi:hypothetical protein
VISTGINNHLSCTLKQVVVWAWSLILLASCSSTGDHFLRDGGITRRLDGQTTSLTGGEPGPTGSSTSQSGEAQQVALLLEDALEFLRSGEPRRSLDKLLEAQLIDGWERTPKAPAVEFWTGHSYELVGEPNAAIAAFRMVRKQYPDSPFAERATRRLQRLREQQQDRP